MRRWGIGDGSTQEHGNDACFVMFAGTLHIFHNTWVSNGFTIDSDSTFVEFYRLFVSSRCTSITKMYSPSDCFIERGRDAQSHG